MSSPCGLYRSLWLADVKLFENEMFLWAGGCRSLCPFENNLQVPTLMTTKLPKPRGSENYFNVVPKIPLLFREKL